MSFDGKQLQLAIIGRFSVIKLKIFLKSSFMLGKSHAEKSMERSSCHSFVSSTSHSLSCLCYILHKSKKKKLGAHRNWCKFAADSLVLTKLTGIQIVSQCLKMDAPQAAF